tara:strand:- start:412 stop:1032 length:621 start_codon:yes stop_codon:yes gene_type:complete
VPEFGDTHRSQKSLGTEKRKNIIESAMAGEYSLALEGLRDEDPKVRATSVTVLYENGVLDNELGCDAARDPHPIVRSSVAKSAARLYSLPILELLRDVDFTVVEVACWAAGERGDRQDGVVSVLSDIALQHEDSLCREAAVAALGAIGNADGLNSILKATTDVATVRRRAVLALAPFDNPAVTKALEKALEDRDWQVRQAAEDLLM